jgi:shikimate kinase
VTVTDVNVARCAYLSMAYTTVDDMQMFMKMYMLAKVSGLKMTIAYDDTTCILKRFGLKPVPN